MQDKQYAGFWTRTLATLIDMIILFLSFALLIYLLYADKIDLVLDPSWRIDYIFINYILPFILVIAFWKLKNATPGKMLFKAEIVDATTFQVPSTRQYIIRNLAYIVSFIPLGLGFLWVAFDKRKQGFHDKLANTLVIQPRQDKKKKSALLYIGYFFGSVFIMLLGFVTVMGLLSEMDYIPNAQVYRSASLSDGVKEDLLEKHLIKDINTLVYLHPDSMLSFTDSGTIITKEGIGYFDAKFPFYQVSFKEMKSLEIKPYMKILDTTMLGITSYDKDNMLLIEVFATVNNAEIQSFTQEIKSLWAEANEE